MLRKLWKHLCRYVSNERGTWGAVASAVVGSAVSYGASQLGGGGEGGTPGGIATWTAPQYEWREGDIRRLSDYYNRNLSRVEEGRYPVWYQNLLPTLREGMERPLYEETFGLPGQRTGTMQAATEAGAMGGVGPKALVAGTNKALLDYKNRRRGINEYLASLGYNTMSNAETDYLSGLQGLPEGPTSQGMQYSGTPASNQKAELYGQIGSTLGGALGGAANTWISGWGKNPAINTSTTGQRYLTQEYTPTWLSQYSGGKPVRVR